MTRFFNDAKRFRRDAQGATAVEYAMIVGVVALGTLVALNQLSGRLQSVFDSVLPSASKSSGTTN